MKQYLIHAGFSIDKIHNSEQMVLTNQCDMDVESAAVWWWCVVVFLLQLMRNLISC